MRGCAVYLYWYLGYLVNRIADVFNMVFGMWNRWFWPLMAAY
ncbi:putative membrane protein [Yersinia pestis PY-03]|nr:putative membrane protein [Yersinia pestis PY-03]